MHITPELDLQSAVPIYRQLHEHIAGLVRSGKLGRGERLPATRELAGLLGLNRATVAAAYELLETEGLISSHVGRGSFVTGAPAGPRKGLDWGALLERPADPTPAFSLEEDGISFAASRPSEELFPLDDVRAASAEVMAQPDLPAILQLGSPSGYEPLRRRLLDHALANGTARSGDELIITNGCQQALDLIGRVLVEPGDTVAVEDPVYPGLKNLFARMGARLAGVPADAAGMNMEALGRTLEGGAVKLVVVTSSFQNPTGGTLSRAARAELLRLTAASGAVLVENDIYGELRYAGDPLPSLKELDESGNAVLLRSFSKVAFPGLRVGWIIAPRPLIERLVEAKQLADLHTDQLSQALLLRFLESGRLEAHLRCMLTAGAARLAATLAACQRHLPPGTRYTKPLGGMNVWVELPAPLDAGELLPRAERAGVAYLPGKYFAVSRPAASALRLCFAGLEPDRIRKGIAILGEIFSSEMERTRGARNHPAPAIV
ncbi:MAG TPA: PLP-dependent aminotransferase family protein [Bryobacteraceae bacterium]|nr:PLP-dependent aminotransferase family protein [Bryobacteraceae bacterium]